MKLNPIAPNLTEVELDTGTTVLFSYKTPVAVQLFNGQYFRTNKKWSATTTRHINKWLNGCSAEPKEQSYFDSLVEA